VSYLLGVDIGGTFTDACAVSTEDGTIFTAKSPTTPHNLIEGVMSAVGLVAEQAGLDNGELLRRATKFAHGTTQTTNAVFTWRGATVGLITTAGFADEILIMRARGRVAGLSLSARRHLRDTNKPPQIVPRERIEEVAERVDHRGRVIVPLTETEAERAVDALLARGVDAIAVSLLWAHENPAHELLLERVIRERGPGLHVSLSHRLAPVVGEYERTSTTVVNAFVAPTLERYIEDLAARLEGEGLGVPLLVLQCSGGVARADQTVPVNTIESGPAASMVAVKALASAMGHANVIATDVGGTTFKVGLLTDGDWLSAQETIINQYSLLIPMIDLVSIGAGGGSIAWVDDARLRIGPDSAGADPGPACYGWGGDRPTVTDADAILGFLNPDNFLGGRLRLRVDLAEEAMRRHVGYRLFGGDTVAAAAAVRQVVDAQMADLVRKATIERGYDPRDFVLVAYGGAGPVHAADYAQGLGVREIIVPQAATAYSAYGAAASDIHHSLQRSVLVSTAGDDRALEKAFASLEGEARHLLEQQDVATGRTRIVRWADMRYERQLHDVRVTLADDASEGFQEALRAAFTDRYRSLFGSGAVLGDAPVRILRIGVDVIGLIEKPDFRRAPSENEDAAGARLGTRRIHWPRAAAWIDTPIYDGHRLRPGNRVAGPAVVEYQGTNAVLPDAATAQVDPFGNLVIVLKEA
jgi:N-methylhydantoinase A